MNDVVCTCGVCRVNERNCWWLRRCSICQFVLCRGMQEGPRTVCTKCILSNQHRLAELFNGKTDGGSWIDLATRLPIPTCMTCDCPLLLHRCDNQRCIRDRVGGREQIALREAVARLRGSQARQHAQERRAEAVEIDN
jgi:hypothetical protein